MRIWFREWKDNHLIRDTMVENHEDDTRTHKVMGSLEKACHEFDLAVPVWLDRNIREFKRTSKTRFNKDNFIEEISFDYFEIMVIEEDF